MTIVAIHQPNYAPWLGYFDKMAKADIFVFLDDAQFSKQSYINRVKILGHQSGRWLTQPVSVSLGQGINEVAPARENWVHAHLDTLRGFYRRAAAFRAVWPCIEALYADLPQGDLARINRTLIEGLADRLGITASFRNASSFETGDAKAGQRLALIAGKIAPGCTYLSGKGGSKYQDPATFENAGLSLAYSDFKHPVYDQGVDFVAGLSMLDAAFHLGWDGAAALIQL